MAQRPIWRGHLRLALVSCPVALFNARHERENLRFHFINPQTGNRVRMVTLDGETGDELRRADLVKGYEFEKHRYLLLDDEDFEAARTETSAVLKVDKFVPAGSIDPVYFDGSYYMAPDGDAGDDVYGVLRQAFLETGFVALSRVTMARRERAVLITPMEGGLAVHSLLEERDLNRASEFFGKHASGETDPEMVSLAKQLIKRQAGTYDPADVEDRYETRMRAVIAAKLQGEGLTPESAPAVRESNVIDLMAALKKSLGQTADPPPAKPRKAAAKTGEKAPAKSSRKQA
jgi:DNA end-binding protein Ku